MVGMGEGGELSVIGSLILNLSAMYPKKKMDPLAVFKINYLNYPVILTLRTDYIYISVI